MSPRLRWRRSLALRTVIGVVVLVALVLAAMGTTTALIAQRTLSAQLDDSVRQAMSRSWNFLGDQGGGPGAAQPSSPAEPSEAPEPSGAAEPSDVADPTSAADPADDGRRDPLAAPGQPVGVLALVQEDGRTTSARYLGEDGEIRELPAEDVAAIEDSGVLNEAAEPQQDSDAPVRALELSIGAYRMGASQAPSSPQDGAEKAPDGQAQASQAPAPSASPQDAQVRTQDRVVVTGLPAAQIERTTATIVTTVVLVSLAALAVIAAAGLWWVRRSLEPLRRISRSASDVAQLPLAQARVPVADHLVRGDLAQEGSEVGEVGRALNTLLLSVDHAMTRRDASEAQLRRFVADASHELRTPLASVRGYADMLRLREELTPDGQRILDRLLAQAQRMNGLVEDLLLLARLDADAGAQQQPSGDPVDLGEITAEAVMDAQAAGPEHAWELDVPDEPVPVRVPAAQLQQTVANLLSNARKHTPAGTRITTSLRIRDGRAVLAVADDGPGIPEHLQPTAFDRFARGDDARTAGPEGSSGLGLAIVRTIAESAGGSARLKSPAPGHSHGAVVEIELPLA